MVETIRDEAQKRNTNNKEKKPLDFNTENVE